MTGHEYAARGLPRTPVPTALGPAPEIDWSAAELGALPSPCYVVDEGLLIRNLELLSAVADAAGCKILLAQKGFSMFSLYPLIGRYLAGAAASSLFEARLAAEEMGKEVHIFAPAYREDEFDEIARFCGHIIFNSFGQWRRFRARAGGAECGVRINPEYSEIKTALYDPCAKYSRLGVTIGSFLEETAAGGSVRTEADGRGGSDGLPELDGLSGLHFHTMCEQNSDTLARTLAVVEEKFGRFLPAMKWVNFGGGHHITRPDYDIRTLVDCVRSFSARYGVQVYLEPGEAIALNTGFLISTVLDVADNGMKLAILDTSAAC
ncbi:MAG: carboxynorspermidine decarboxylase, partial [Clostridiales bacterium]|nr:carboxynorspermidine decarboxylase [Clostridiales bacterium]